MKILLTSIIGVCLTLALTGCSAGQPYYAEKGYRPYSTAYLPYGYYDSGYYRPGHYQPVNLQIHIFNRRTFIDPHHKHRKPAVQGSFKRHRHYGTLHTPKEVGKNRRWKKNQTVRNRDQNQANWQQRKVDHPDWFQKMDHKRGQSRPQVTRPDRLQRWEGHERKSI